MLIFIAVMTVITGGLIAAVESVDRPRRRAERLQQQQFAAR